VEVKDILACGGTVRLDEVQSRQAKRSAQSVGYFDGRAHDRCGIVRTKAPNVSDVASRNDESVTAGRWIAVQERHHVIILVDNVGRRLSAHDGAEDATHLHDSTQPTRRGQHQSRGIETMAASVPTGGDH
jgi:hypothetical protein